MQAELHGVLPVHNGGFEPLQKSALRWSNRLKQAVAICNSLNMVNKHTVVGVDMECTMFKAVEARFLVCAMIYIHYDMHFMIHTLRCIRFRNCLM